MELLWKSGDERWLSTRNICYGLVSVVLVRILQNGWSFWITCRRDAAIKAQHGCLPPPELDNGWTIGLNWLSKLFQADVEMHLLDFLCSIAKDYEPRNMLSQNFLFGPRAYHVLDPPNLQAVLSTNFHDYDFGVRDQVFAPLLGDGIFTQQGAAWKHSREMLRKQFIATQYRSLEPFREHLRDLVDRISANDTPVIDLQPLFFKLTLDTTTALLFGRSAYSLKASDDIDAVNLDFAENFNIAQAGLAKRFRIAPFQFLYSPRRFRKACSMVHKFVEDYIDQEYLSSKGKSEASDINSFMRQLLAESSDRASLRDQLLNVLLAGRDTTACCLSWTFRLLLRHPEKLERLRREIRVVMGSEDHPTREQVQKMRYLSCVIKESLRLFPPVPLNNRTATKTTILPRGGGPDASHPILVRKGEMVVFSQYVNSRCKNIFGQDADDFRPERWEDGLSNGDQFGWAYFPFSGGPRACLGQDFAVMEISCTIVKLLQVFPMLRLPVDESQEDKPGKERQKLTLVLLPADGCRVEFGDHI